MPRQTADYDPMMDELPPELAAEYRAEQRKRKMAEAMLGQAMQPLQAPEVKGRFQGAISPLQGIAQVAKAYMANKGLEGSDAAMAGLGGRISEGRNAAIQKMTQAMAGTSEESLPADVFGPPKPAVPGSVDAGISAGMGSPYTQKIAQAMLLEKMKHLTSPKINEPFTLKPGDIRYGADGKPIVSSPNKPVYENATPLEKLIAARDALPAGDPSRATYDAAIKKESEWRPSSTVNVAAPVTPVTIQDPNNPNATIVIDGRTQKVLGAGPKLSQVGGDQQKLTLNLPQAKLRTESIVQNLDKLDSAMTALHDNPDLPRITGTIMGRTPNLTNEATSAQTDLDSIKSQIFQSSLQAMREASKTGGAVGNVSDREGDKLERTLSGLDQSAGTPKFKENLKKAIEQVRTSKLLIKNAFDEQYGGVESQTRRASDKPGAVLKFDAQGNLVQ